MGELKILCKSSGKTGENQRTNRLLAVAKPSPDALTPHGESLSFSSYQKYWSSYRPFTPYVSYRATIRGLYRYCKSVRGKWHPIHRVLCGMRHTPYTDQGIEIPRVDPLKHVSLLLPGLVLSKMSAAPAGSILLLDMDRSSVQIQSPSASGKTKTEQVPIQKYSSSVYHIHGDSPFVPTKVSSGISLSALGFGESVFSAPLMHLSETHFGIVGEASSQAFRVSEPASSSICNHVHASYIQPGLSALHYVQPAYRVRLSKKSGSRTSHKSSHSARPECNAASRASRISHFHWEHHSYSPKTFASPSNPRINAHGHSHSRIHRTHATASNLGGAVHKPGHSASQARHESGQWSLRFFDAVWGKMVGIDPTAVARSPSGKIEDAVIKSASKAALSKYHLLSRATKRYMRQIVTAADAKPPQ